MANVIEPTEEQAAGWRDWVRTRPEKVRETIEKYGLTPWKLYRMKPTGHRVTLYAVDEPEDGSPCTLKVDISGTFNVVAYERRVFGVAPEDLEECELPGPDEIVGSAGMSIEEALAAIRKLEVGVPQELLDDLAAPLAANEKGPKP